MLLNPYGEIVEEEWLRSAQIRKEIELDQFVVMPNHFHGILMIKENRMQTVGATGRSPLQPRGPAKKSLCSWGAGFKSSVTKRINEVRTTPGSPVWQRNYYEHVIRKEIDLEEIREYIENNRAKWLEDENHPANINRVIRHRRGDRPVAPTNDRSETA
jgi:REP element-mobilizing transposase RayT